jgi:ribonuclease T2
LKKVGEVMPSVQKNSCLERHEWYKHGTCQIDWDADGYFLATVRLTKEFNDNGISAFMKRNLGKSVATEDFLKTVDNAFGKGARNRLMLGCDTQGNLVDVFINLPPQIPDNARLADLIRQAPESFGNRCGNTFTVDVLGYKK